MLLRFLVEKSQNYRFQRFLVRICSKNLPASALVKFVVCSDIQEQLLYWLAYSFWKKQARRVWSSDSEIQLYWVKLKCNIKIGRHLTFSLWWYHLRALRKEIFRGVFRTLSNVCDEVYFAKVVNAFQPFCKKAPL